MEYAKSSRRGAGVGGERGGRGRGRGHVSARQSNAQDNSYKYALDIPLEYTLQSLIILASCVWVLKTTNMRSIVNFVQNVYRLMTAHSENAFFLYWIG